MTTLSCLILSACTSGGPEEPSDTPGAEESPSPTYVSYFWVEREVRVRALDRMMTEGDPQEVVDNTGDLVERLFATGIIQEGENGYRVELDKDEWTPEAVTFVNRLDSGLAAAMKGNEVTWCGDPLPGDEFVRGYTDEFWEAYDTAEEYEESVANYVDCGTGELN
ncbi:hypothetical protein ACFWTE_04375 [Nocardiopsis sp. NPDC058631]|uniref:hypothetical protein n=1 Tax=Nocardiopsis sp. NPDC058631 TaxID=3346566 RepID=UPI003650C3DC